MHAYAHVVQPEVAHYRFDTVRNGVKLLDVPELDAMIFKDIPACIMHLKNAGAYKWIGAVLKKCVPFQ